MFKGFNEIQGLNGIPSLGFQSRGKSARPLYGKNNGIFWLEASLGLPSGISDGSLIPYWNDQIFLASFENTNSLLRPVWISADPNFNGLPVIHFNIAGKGLLSRNLIGPTIGTSHTIAIVYQYITQTSGLYSHNSIISNNESSSSTRSGFLTFDHNAPHTNNLGVGYWQGSNAPGNFINGSTAIFDFLPRILILSGDALIKDGVSITKTNNGIISFTANMLGAGISGSTVYCGTFKVAEIAVWNQNYSISECIDISNQLNTKYLIY